MPKTKNATPTHARIQRLAERPKYLRASARGLAAAKGDEVRIDREGGDFHAGLIRGVSLCTRGEALGHGMWLDGEFIDSVAAAAAASPKGVKARFTHPGLSSDGLGKFLGRIMNCQVAGDKAIGDLHFSRAAHRTPDGDLATYVMDLAEGDPEAFAMSIVFEPDYAAEGEFILAHGGKITPSGYVDGTDFVSPDSDNADNLPHARCAALCGCDMVDEPAANPDGLFHREQQFAQEADGVLAYALDLSADPPTCVAFDVHPDRIKSFVSRFLDAHGLQVTPKTETQETTPMSKTTKLQAAEAEDAPDATPTDDASDQAETATPETSSSEPQAEPTQPAEQTDTDTAQQEPAGDQPPAPDDGNEADGDQNTETAGDATDGEPQLSEGQVECGRFIAAFGADGGQWYAEGLSFEAAQQRHAEALAAENAALRKRLAAAGEGLGEAEPLDFQPDGKGAATGGKAPLADKLGANTARVAAGIKIRSAGDSK